MWKFDISNEVWSSIPIEDSFLPPPRSEFGHAKFEDNLIVFGGKGETDLFNDLYTYNIKLNKWELISNDSTSKPSARRASCLASNDEFIIIYGGVEAKGYSNELWKFEWSTNNYILLDNTNAPPESAFSQCHIYRNSDNQMLFQVYMGENDGESPIAFIYEYNLSTNVWTTIQEPSYDYRIARSKAAIFMIKDQLILAGGSLWNYFSQNYIDILDVKSGQVNRVNYLPANTFYGASAYYRNKIYIHGGSGSFGTLPLKNIIVNDLLVIDLNEECEPLPNMCISECSKGSYYKEGTCTLCPKGSYSESIGSKTCILCPSGYFSDINGAESMKTCKPCPYGYFSDKEGQSMCMNCPSGSLCSFNKIKVDLQSDIPKYESIQPELMEYESETVAENSLYFNLSISIISVIIIVPLLVFSQSRRLLRKIDLYSDCHNYENEKVMYIRRTLIGGVFSYAFIFAALAIVFNILLSYGLDNIRENKGLVPLVALEKQYENVIYRQFPAKKAFFEFNLINYGGECGNQEGKCTKDLELLLDKIDGEIEKLTCEKIDLDCKVSISIKDFNLIGNGSVKLKLSESLSFSSGIIVKVETSSSIPDEVSSITSVIWSDKYTYFRGSSPCIFSFLMTPSLFTTDTDVWKNDQKGYHISLQNYPISGSQMYFTEMQFVKNFEVNVQLNKNNAVLLTQRLQVQPLSILLGNLAGSIIGILGLVGFFMKRFEKIYEKYIRYVRYERNLKQIKRYWVELLSKNFNVDLVKILNLNPARTGRSELQSMEYLGEYPDPGDPMSFQVKGLSSP